MRILVLEDEIELCNTIAVDTCYDGNEAYELMHA